MDKATLRFSGRGIILIFLFSICSGVTKDLYGQYPALIVTPPKGIGLQLLGNRFFTFNTVVRVNQIETSRDVTNGEDEIKPDETTKVVTWQLITRADVEIVADGAILKQDGKKLKLTNFSHPDIRFTVISLDPPPHKLDKQIDNLKRVELRIPVELRNENTYLAIAVRLEGAEVAVISK
ncbi:MAG: hypothetical protein WC865_01025 [Bacteroidales bacterium]